MSGVNALASRQRWGQAGVPHRRWRLGFAGPRESSSQVPMLWFDPTERGVLRVGSPWCCGARELTPPDTPSRAACLSVSGSSDDLTPGKRASFSFLFCFGYYKMFHLPLQLPCQGPPSVCSFPFYSSSLEAQGIFRVLQYVADAKPNQNPCELASLSHRLGFSPPRRV